MKILVLNYEFPPIGGGASAICGDLCKQLQLRGHEVSIVTMAYKDLPIFENSKQFRIFRVRCLRTKQTVCHPWEQLTYCVSAYFFIRKLVKNEQFDVIHCHFIIPTGLVVLWLKKKFNLKYIITAQGSDVIGHNNKRFKYLYKLVKKPWIAILKNAEFVTAPSQFLIDKIHLTFPDLPCKLIPNGLFKEKYFVSARKKSILTMSRLQESKGVQEVIEAFAATDLGDGWQLDILGDGPYKPVLQSLISRLNMNDKIKLHGFVSDEKHYQFLSEASIFISASWFEALPVSVIEAMASKNYILASDIPPHRQLIGEECLFSSVNELKILLQKAMMRKDFVIDYSLEEYEWKNIIEKYEKILLETETK